MNSIITVNDMCLWYGEEVLNDMTQKGYMNDFYKQFEKLNNNFEKANQTISKMSFELSCVRQELKEAINLNKKLEKQNRELLLEIERLKNKACCFIPIIS